MPWLYVTHCMYEMKEYAYEENRSEKQKSSPEHKKVLEELARLYV
jgi:hypothetical protein